MNIVEPVLFQCKLNPMTPAICVPGTKYGSVNYGLLEKFIHNAARNGLQTGIAPGSLVATYISDAILDTSLTLGLMYAGMTTLSLRGPKPVTGINPDVVLTDTPAKITGDVTVLAVDQSWLDGGGAAVSPINAHQTDANDLCRIILSSGSTGVPKGVAFSHEFMAARTTYYMYSKGPRFAHCQRFFCDLGLSTSPGFGYVMSLLTRGGTIYFLGPDPSDILQTIDLHRVQGMATSPYGLGEFLRFFEADSAFEVPFDHIICQGAKLSPDLSYRARARMCQNLYSSFGSTETSTVAFGPVNLLSRVPNAVGYIQPGVTVEVVDGSGAILPPLRDGALRIRTAHMAAGYVGDPETTQRLFRNGFFYSGDIGHLTPEGLLVVTGREKAALNIGGETVHPEVVEQIIASFEGIHEAGVVAVDNELGIAELIALIVAPGLIDDGALRNYCAIRLPSSCVPVEFIVTDKLPRGGQGKLERQRLAEIVVARRKVATGE